MKSSVRNVADRNGERERERDAVLLGMQQRVTRKFDIGIGIGIGLT